MKANKRSLLLLDIFKVFFKIGSFTFGGGYAMIPLIEREVAENKKWVSEEEIVDVFAVAQSMPGAIAINSSTFIGYKIAGIKGAVVATVGVVLPAFLIITLIAAFFSRFQNAPSMQAIFAGIRPAIVGLISLAAIKVGKASIVDKTGIVLAVLTVFAIVLLEVQAAFAILGGAAVGLAIYIFLPGNTADILSRGGEEK